jgi:hypothetical protein
MGQAEIEASFSHMATQRKVSVSTYRQVLSPLIFLYQKVPGIEVIGVHGDSFEVVRGILLQCGCDKNPVSSLRPKPAETQPDFEWTALIN